jgi:hypothetical protein
MKYTPSQDGIDRATVIVRLRFTREDLQEIRDIAKKSAEDSGWHDWIESHAQLGIEEGMSAFDGSYEQRYGKGDG